MSDLSPALSALGSFFDSQQGQLQGATSRVQSVSQMLGPFLFTLTFAYFIGAKAPLQLPGAAFLLASLLLLMALAIAMRTLARRVEGRPAPLPPVTPCREVPSADEGSRGQ